MASFRKSAANRQPRGLTINGTGHIDASKFKGRSGVMVPNRVFVGGICPTASESDLLPLFGKYGTVKAIKIVIDENGQSKRYGFVTYEKADDCLRLQHDGRDLMFNEKRLIVAPAIMKNPPLSNRYPEPNVVPVTPNLYFATNNIPYQYQDGSAVYPGNPYVPPLSVIPTVSDAAYYPNNYGIPATPYQGTALYYPVPSNGSPVMVGHQPYPQYQSVGTNNSVYANSPPNSSSPPNPAAAKNCSSMTSNANSSDMHLSHNTPLISATPPNVSTLPPPLPYQFAHQPQFYNGSIIPQYTGEVCYNMVHNAYYPMMTVNSQEAFTLPYYEVAESCVATVSAEDNHTESPNHYHSAPSTIMSTTPELSGCDSSPTPINSNCSSECKSMPPMGPPPSIPPPPQPSTTSGEHAREFPTETTASPPSTATSASTHSPIATAVMSVQTQPSVEYTSSTYVQHRSAGAVIYQNAPIPQQNVYFNSLYVTEPTNASLGQCQYSKNLSEHFVSDHLPKRETIKYQSKKYAPPQAKDMPPHIPKFPFFNNNYPGYVNRNIKDKDFKNMNGGKNPDMKMIPQQRFARNIVNGSNPPPKHRVFHNQNQYGGPPRPKGDRMMSQNGHHPRSGPGNLARQSYNMTSAPSNSPYNGYANYVPYPKHTGYDGYRKTGPMNNNNGSYRLRYDRPNGSNEAYYPKNSVSDERSKKNTSQPDNVNSLNNDELNSVSVPESEESQQPEEQQEQQQQQLCAEMQNLAV